MSSQQSPEQFEFDFGETPKALQPDGHETASVINDAQLEKPDRITCTDGTYVSGNCIVRDFSAIGPNGKTITLPQIIDWLPGTIPPLLQNLPPPTPEEEEMLERIHENNFFTIYPYSDGSAPSTLSSTPCPPAGNTEDKMDLIYRKLEAIEMRLNEIFDRM